MANSSLIYHILTVHLDLGLLIIYLHMLLEHVL